MRRPACATEPELAPYFDGLDHVDVKTVHSARDLRTFLAAMLSHRPAWVTALFAVRSVLVRAIGLRQPRGPSPPRFTPETVPMQPGAAAIFFTVRAAREGAHWLADVDEAHLWAAVAVVRELPGPDGVAAFRVVTLVRYHRWTGRLYFNVIRPFHHLVVRAMARAGAQRSLPV